MTEQTTITDESVHGAFIHSRMPAWFGQAHPEAIKALYRSQVPNQPEGADGALLAAQVRNKRSRLTAARALGGFKGIVEFAAPLLQASLKNRFGLELDVNRHELLHFSAAPSYTGDVSQVKLLSRQTLLEAALRNFTGNEVFTRNCALAPLGAVSIQANIASTGEVSTNIRYRERLSVTPQQFASLCRELDLGQAYQQHLNEVFARPAVAPAMVQANQDALAEQAHIARLQGHISDAAHTMLLALIAGQGAATLDGQPVRCSGLQLLGVALGDVLVIGPMIDGSDSEQPCVVYIPGDPNHPLKEYASRHRVTVYLRQQLYRPEYLKFFLGFVPRREQARVYRHYNVFESQLPKGVDVLVERPIPNELFGALHERSVAKARDDARVLAVPTADVDHQAWLAQVEHYLSIGLNVVNVAAFFVPGLGEVMMGVMGAQLMSDVFHGIEAWEADETAEAAGYLQSLSLNIAFVAGLGIVGSQVAAALKPSAFVEGLERVELPDGQARLWKPDLREYRQVIELPATLQPNARGQYVFEGKHWVRLEGDLYEQAFDPRIDRWRVRHPSDAQAYQPVLEHNGEGAWRHGHERPLQWSRTRLLRRIGHSVDGLSDAELAHALQISGIHEDALRRMHVERQPVPPLLADTLERLQIDRQVQRMIEQIRRGEPIPEHMTYPLALVVELPGWPADAVLQVYHRPELQGGRVEYGSASGGEGAPLKVSRAEVLRGELAERLIDQLSEMQITRLLGDGVGPQRAVRVQALRDRLADYSDERRSAIFDSVYHSPASVPDPLSVLLRERFPRLNEPLARRLLGTLTTLERTQWVNSTLMPSRLVSLATQLSTELPLARAYEGLYRPTLAQAHSDRLLLACLGRLPGWSSQVCLELRGGQVRGPLLERLGSPSAPIKRVLVKGNKGYRAYDGHEELHSLAPASSDNDLYKAILQALPDVQRDALMLGVHDSESLKARVLSVATGARDEAGRWLWSYRVSGWDESGRLRGGGGNQSHQRGAGGYPPAGALASPEEQRYRELYPQASTTETLEQFIRWGEQGLAPRLEITRLEAQLARLDSDLANWAAGSIYRENARTRIIEAWQRISTNLTETGEPTTLLFLSGQALRTHDLLSFPLLTADFTHVSVLWLDGNGLTELPLAFLRNFPALQRVSASQNRLQSFPAGLNSERLTALDLSHNQIAWDAAAQTALADCTNLDTLELSHNPLYTPPDLAPLTRLSVVRLTDSGLTALPAGLEAIEAPTLVDLADNRIETLPNNVVRLPTVVAEALNLEGNALDDASLNLITQHFADHQVDLLVAEVDYRFLLEGANPAQLAIWQRLRTPSNLRFIREVRYIIENPLFDIVPATSRRRLWGVLEWMDSNEAFRQQALAYNPRQLFDLELLGRVQRANQLAAPRQTTEQLLALATDYIRVARIDTELQVLTEDAEGIDTETFEILGQLCFKQLAREPALALLQAPTVGEEVNVDQALAGAIELMTPQWLDQLRLRLLNLNAGTQEGLDALFAVNTDDEPLIAFWQERLRERYQTRFAQLRQTLDDQLEEAEATLHDGAYLIEANLLRAQFETDTQALMRTLTREIFEGIVEQW
ncbi:leucine-rich repeat domain-containing protein [Pseudomonas akapageensis]|uniref:leucine-rich repeat domain-containing protein n=1 Tax=Pseudomonas akapageensis TaxID=2609961 RepID=UPI00140E29C6|nr:leucine-rich repeat domain-containing protein [Pseudomonas akapageensis]